MLWLQLPGLHKKHVYLAQLFIVSLGIHCLVIGCLLFSLKKTGPHALTIHGRALTEAPIVLMPLHKVVHATNLKKVGKAPVKQAVAAKKPQPQKKVAPKKPQTSLAKKLPEPKKAVDVKPKAPVVAQKIEEKKAAVVEKKVEKQPEVVQQEIVKPEVVADAEVIHVGRDELVEIALQRHIMEQLKKVWQPPAGISQDVCCTVYFVVDDEGKAINVRMEQSSGTVLYDIGARTAILRAQFPVQARKKEFTVAFKP